MIKDSRTNRVIALLPVGVRNALWKIGLRIRRFSVEAYSQEGEDLILARAFENHAPGFYVDVGAHHPTRYSNTFYFYKRGWNGVNIDAAPGSMDAFRRSRPRDINVETAISAQPGTELTFYVFNDPALNTADAQLARERRAAGFRLVREVRVPARRLGDVLHEHVPDGRKIDFMSVDVEGFDLDVLRSNDWDAYRPGYVLCESIGVRVEEFLTGELYAFMRGRGYGLFAKTVNTAIFVDCHPA